jgi:peptidoglycan/LPS O-acetylase OafA/YrhL
VPLTAIALLIEDRSYGPHFMMTVPIALTVFLLVLSRDRRGTGLREWRPGRLIGDASYSIYLFHFIPMLVLKRVDSSVPLSPATYFIALMVSGVAGGLLVYYLVERPIMRLVRRMREARRRQAAAPAKTNARI